MTPATKYFNAAQAAHVVAVAILYDQLSDRAAAATAVAYTAQILFDAETAVTREGSYRGRK